MPTIVSKKMGKHTTELVLGLIGGILGFLFVIGMMGFISAGDVVFGTEGSETSQDIISSGWLALLFSTVGIIGAAIVKSKRKLAGWMMIIASIGGIWNAGLFYLLSFILLVTAGIMALVRK